MEFLDLVRAWPGAFGSALATFWLRDETLGRRFVLFLGGTVAAILGTPDLANNVHLQPGLLAFMLGLGSMAFIAKVFETIQAFPLGKLAKDVSYKWLGLPTTKPAPLSKE